MRAPAWLAAAQCTKPFTLKDAMELYEMLKHDLPSYAVDVYWTSGEVVHVRVYLPEQSLTCVLAEDLDVV